MVQYGWMTNHFMAIVYRFYSSYYPCHILSWWCEQQQSIVNSLSTTSGVGQVLVVGAVVSGIVIDGFGEKREQKSLIREVRAITTFFRHILS